MELQENKEDRLETYRNRGRNNARSLDMTERICHLIGHKLPQFQALPGYFKKKKLKII